MINYNEFKTYVKENLINYLPEGYTYEGIIMQEVQKNNGLVLCGISARKENSNISPTIYLEQFYDDYKNGSDLKRIMLCIAKTILEHENPTGYTGIERDFKKWNWVKERVIMVLVNAEKNKKLLDDVPHVIFEDLAIIFKVLLEDYSGMASITIHNNHLEYWGVSLQELHEHGINNTERLLPVTVLSMNEVMERSGAPKELLADMNALPEEKRQYIISNERCVNGAASILYTEYLSKLAEKLDADLYVLPSSMHECIALSAKGADSASLRAMVKDINESEVAEEERLSDNVYFFDAKNKTLTLVK